MEKKRPRKSKAPFKRSRYLKGPQPYAVKVESVVESWERLLGFLKYIHCLEGGTNPTLKLYEDGTVN